MLLYLCLALVLAIALFQARRTWLGWVLPVALLHLGWWRTGIAFPSLFVASASVWCLAALVGGVRPVRRALLTPRLLPLLGPLLPRMSETERIAIEAGTVWWEAEFFTGKPNWRRLLGLQPQTLSARERAFLAGPCEQVCSMVNDWDVRKRGDLPAEAWDYLKQQGFLGMIIPESYGGLGFSAAAHSEVVVKLSSRSVTLAVTVMVPNSLGPAELLLHYGTEEQKNHYLPRLARGEEVPCFALTEPGAGSDAGSMQSTGVVCEGTFQGKRVLGVRLNWNKRYITLAPVATVIGLAFKLRDPEHLLGPTEELGITCALIPADLPGVEIGERHDPLGVPFMNGPTRGQDVFVPLDFIIGGRAMAGRGWMMLMQSLSAGRGISLPSMATGAAELATRAAGAYATIRKQFDTPIGKFEGVQAPLARIAGFTYAMDGARRMTSGAVDAGEKPAVASAIVKCYLTEGMRAVTNDAMDIVGGAGISLGPRNVLGPGYMALPVGITVEGANILTRSMIIFGQGAIRCHPYVQDELAGAHGKDLARFDRAFFGHVGFVFTNMARTLVHALTDGAFAGAPVAGPEARHFRRLTRASAAFALTADFAMGTLGGALKRKEAITGRLADALAWQFLASAALKRFHDEGREAADRPALDWICEHALHQTQEALLGVYRNLPMRPVGWLLRALAFPLGRPAHGPSDRATHALAKELLEGRALRERLTRGIYMPPAGELGLGQLEAALQKVVRGLQVQAKIDEAVRSKRLEKRPKETLAERALAGGAITPAERKELAAADEARAAAVAVDAFSQHEFATSGA
jgi:acyl-CoA dehydrogenase